MVRPREFDEKKVLEAAQNQFWSTGFAGTSMDAVAAATGLGKGSLYGAFGSKRDLFHRVFQDYCRTAISATEEQLRGPDEEALERLSAFFQQHAITCSEPSRRGCLLAKGAAELAEHDDKVASDSLQAYESLQRIFAVELDACQRHGDISPQADAGQLATLLLSVHRGMEALGRAGTDVSTLQGIARTALASLPPAGQ